ncbi:hypothetical protein KUTeg_009883 [Tegillarca granosa]|uniref:Uncharacterized protein n=1 Tax=Tegillarca granosa TaxID=220873 RepID=A0ABQ9FA67_TEGGR|nr:hypothetical protein KUTeg_009883 [Tegillarca granosa]
MVGFNWSTKSRPMVGKKKKEYQAVVFPNKEEILKSFVHELQDTLPSACFLTGIKKTIPTTTTAAVEVTQENYENYYMEKIVTDACTLTGSTDPNVILEHLPQLSKIDDLQKQLQEEPMEVDNPSDNVVDNVMGNVYFCPICHCKIREPTMSGYSHRDQSIACDKCHLWYHFTCVHMTKSKAWGTFTLIPMIMIKAK